MRVIVALTSVALGTWSSVVFGRDESGAIGYALAFSVAMEAQRNCEGFTPDEPALGRLERAAGLSGAGEDDAWLSAEFGQLKREHQAAILKDGAAKWCSDAAKLFGPASPVPVLRIENK